MSFQTPGTTNGRLEKMGFTWEGPFSVIDRISALNYKVRDLRYPGAASKVVHVRHLKPYFDPKKRITETLVPSKLSPQEIVGKEGKEEETEERQGEPESAQLLETKEIKKGGVSINDLPSDDKVGELLPGDFLVYAILDRKKFRKRGKDLVHYLVRFQGYGPEYDKWLPRSQLNSPELLAEFEKKWRSAQHQPALPMPAKKKKDPKDIPPPSAEDMSL